MWLCVFLFFPWLQPPMIIFVYFFLLYQYKTSYFLLKKCRVFVKINSDFVEISKILAIFLPQEIALYEKRICLANYSSVCLRTQRKKKKYFSVWFIQALRTLQRQSQQRECRNSQHLRVFCFSTLFLGAFFTFFSDDNYMYVQI